MDYAACSTSLGIFIIASSATELMTLEENPPVVDVSPPDNETPIESEIETTVQDALGGTPFALSDPSQPVLM